MEAAQHEIASEEIPLAEKYSYMKKIKRDEFI